MTKFVGTNEIAQHYGVSKQLAHKWTRRSDFPEPIAGPDHPTNPLSMGSVWDFEAVKRWGKRHGRKAGEGPRAPAGLVIGPLPARELRVAGSAAEGFAVQHKGEPVAGPYASKADAAAAKANIVAGRPVKAAA